MENFEQILRNALDGLGSYPDSVEELAIQLNFISVAIENEADKYNIAYDLDNPHVIEVV